ncbi:NADH oxidase [Streptomyces sp. NPDC047928]|uniref:NADH oxidase n=1 Tax=unclassified Streptomyces TaxID=2593676 RepID=UPI003719339A
MAVVATHPGRILVGLIAHKGVRMSDATGPVAVPGHTSVHLWSLAEDVTVEPGDREGELVLAGRWGRERIDDAAPVVQEALRRMELGPVLLANLAAGPVAGSAAGPDGSPVLLPLVPLLRRLDHLLVRTLGLDDLRGPLLSVIPLARRAPFAPVRLPAGRPVRLPPDVSFTLRPAGVTLEAPGSAHRVILHRPEAAWVAAMLAWPVTPAAVSAALPLPPAVTGDILDYLAAARMAAPAVDDEPGAG